MAINIIIIISSILAVIIPYAPQLTYGILKIEFILYVAIIAIEIAKTKRLSLFSIWVFAFIYIILSEMLIIAIDDFSYIYTIPILFYLLSNNIVLLGYRLHKTQNSDTESCYFKVKDSNLLLASLIIFVFLYLYFYRDNVLQTYYFGRILKSSMGGGSLGMSLVTALGILTPSFIGYYFRYIQHKSIIYSILISMPIFVYQFILATRFKLLFSILPFLVITGIISLNLNNFKKNITLTVCVLLFGIGSTYITESRNLTYNEQLMASLYESEQPKDFFQYCAQEMSPEGVIFMAKKANDYFDNNPLSYGKESAFILYFWVPRTLWSDKPTMLDHWLIRKTENVSDAYSSASGFMGELRADFGWFALFAAFLIGILLKKCDTYLNKFDNNNPSINYVFATTLISTTFFFVRSPLTTLMTLLGEFVVFFIIRFIFFNKVSKE